MIKRIIFSLLLSCVALTALAAGKPVQIADNAPDSYVVKKGDTLWAISAKFLKEPWRWPEVWRMNRDQIRNPHLIYPGQVVVLDRNGPRLSIGRPVNNRLQPKVYEESVGNAIPSIPTGDITPFLTQPLVVDEAGLRDAAKIVATQESRVMVGAGDTVYVTGVKPGVQNWQIFRPAKPVIDPVSGKTLGYEAIYLGNARVVADGEPATLTITDSREEIGKGDRLVPAAKPDVLAYSPHAPEKDIAGHIVNLYNSVGTGETGRNYVVTLNVGAADGIEVGHVLAVYRDGADVVYREEGAGPKERYKLPEERYGLVFVFRTFDHLSYALVMNNSRPVAARDAVRNP